MRRFLCVLSALTSPFFFGRINMRRFLCVLSLMALAPPQLRRPSLTTSVRIKAPCTTRYSLTTAWGMGRPRMPSMPQTSLSPPAAGSTTEWYRKDGYVWNVGDTIGLDVVAVAPLTSSVMGLVASQSHTAETNARYFYIQDVGNPSPSWNVNYGLTNVAAPADFTLSSPATVTATRTSDTSASYDFAYASSLGGTAHLTGSISLSSGTYYFGMIKYGQYGCISDNLSYTIPQPRVWCF